MVRGKPISIEIRELIIEKHKAGLSVSQISRHLDIVRSTVSRILKRFRETGSSQPGRAKGNLCKLTKRELRLFERHMNAKRNDSIAQLTEWVRLTFDKPLSERTIRRYVSRCGYKYYSAVRKPFLTKLNKRARLRWALMRRGWTTTQWDRVLWSDESSFKIYFGQVGSKVLRKKFQALDPTCVSRCVQRPASVMVWGCMSAAGVGELKVCVGGITAEKYIGVLEAGMLPSKRRLFQRRRFLFQQDNASPHTVSIIQTPDPNTAKRTTAWFASS